jgi:hypothetical protein
MALRSHAGFVPLPAQAPGGIASLVLGLAVLLAPASRTQAQSPDRDQDRIDITGRQNLTLGSGARAYGMGGAFLARADDGTAASWNPAGLSYLRVPEVSLVGVGNSFDTERGDESDRFKGQALDFAAFTWPVGIGEVRGAVQLSYQRSISFDGRRSIRTPVFLNSVGEPTQWADEALSNGGFDVVAFGTGFRLSRRLRAGVTVNRWVNGYDQVLTRRYLTPNPRPLRKFDLDFRPRGWSFNLGLMWSPIDEVNLAAVYKTPFTADVGLEKARRDFWGPATVEEVTRNRGSSKSVELDFPSSIGFGISWRPRDTLTLSADFTSTSWSRARILDYFEVSVTQRSEGGTPAVPPPPVEFPELQYPTLRAVPEADDPARRFGQQDSQQIRLGAEWVLIKGGLKMPLRAGYFNDRQITPVAGGSLPRFNGLTAGVGIILGSVLLDVAYVHEFGDYLVSSEVAAAAESDQSATPPVRNTLTTDRVFASIIYRFSGRWQP